jgi:hypothetical protein
MRRVSVAKVRVALLAAFVWSAVSCTLPTLAVAAPPLPPEAQEAFAQGVTAANRKDWVVAIDYFDQARRAAPLHPLPLYYLGLAETQVPGRELRAISWLRAFLVLLSEDPQAAHVRWVIDQTEVRARSNLDRLLRLTQQLAEKIDVDSYREEAGKTLDSVSHRASDLPLARPSLHEPSYEEWIAKAWVKFGEKCSAKPTFTEFARALSGALDGRPPSGHYETVTGSMLARIMVDPRTTPAQRRLYDIFLALSAMTEDILLGLRDARELQNIANEGIQREATADPEKGWSEKNTLVCYVFRK